MVAVIYACVYLYALMFVMTLFVYYCVFIFCISFKKGF